MSSLPRTSLLVVVTLLALVVPGLTLPASAATLPSVTAVGSGAGPLKPTSLVVTGRNLGSATAVRFGSLRGTVVRHVSATQLQVRTPRRARVGTVAVAVRSRAGWSRANQRARYTFVAPPVVAGLSTSSGSFAGGDQITLTGRNLSTTRQVLFGDLEATVVSKTGSRIVVRTPAGVVGQTRVIVVTAGGSTGSSGPLFSYVRPEPQDAMTLDPSSDTATPSSVEWVTGGADETTGEQHPWVVGLPAGADVPVVGEQFLVSPGTAAYPSGLAGTVQEVAVQVDESVRVTVAPTDLEDVVDSLQVDYAGPVAPQPTARRRAAASIETGEAAHFEIKGPTQLFCKDADGASVGFGADLNMSVTDVDVSQHLHLGGLVSRPTYDGALTAELETTGKITVDAAATCKLVPAWQNAQRRVIPLGTSGATVSFGPSLEFKVSGKGTWSVVDRTRSTFAVSAELGKSPQYSQTSRSVESRQGGALSFQAEVTAGAQVQLGILDRAGLQGKVLLGVAVSVEAAQANVCVDGEAFGQLSVGVFLDAWVARWEADAFSVKVSIRAFHGCVVADAPETSTEPEITSARMADAQLGADYDEWLSTADGRAGSWSVVRGPLPDGLSLSDAGELLGTPTGPVGDYPVIVQFTDGDGLSATTTIRVRVQPSSGIGGGDLQVTLRWTGAADLDLHVVDPAGEEVYYGNAVSASGGQLDHDANAGCNGPADDDNAVENIFWPAGGAPAGSYGIRVAVYDTCDAPLDWHLTARRNGQLVLDVTGAGDSPIYPVTLGGTAASQLPPATMMPRGQWDQKR